MNYLKLFEDYDHKLFSSKKLKIYRDNDLTLVFEIWSDKNSFNRFTLDYFLSSITLIEYTKNSKIRNIELNKLDKLRFDVSKYLYFIWRLDEENKTKNMINWNRCAYIYLDEIGYDIHDVIHLSNNLGEIFDKLEVIKPKIVEIINREKDAKKFGL